MLNILCTYLEVVYSCIVVFFQKPNTFNGHQKKVSNVLSSKEFDSVWKPDIIYTNKDTNPYYVNVKPEITVGLEHEVPIIIDKNSGSVKKEYPGKDNSMFWSSTIR